MAHKQHQARPDESYRVTCCCFTRDTILSLTSRCDTSPSDNHREELWEWVSHLDVLHGFISQQNFQENKVRREWFRLHLPTPFLRGEVVVGQQLVLLSLHCNVFNNQPEIVSLDLTLAQLQGSTAETRLPQHSVKHYLNFLLSSYLSSSELVKRRPVTKPQCCI